MTLHNCKKHDYWSRATVTCLMVWCKFCCQPAFVYKYRGHECCSEASVTYLLLESNNYSYACKSVASVSDISTDAGFQVPFNKKVGKKKGQKFGKSSEIVEIIGAKSRESRVFQEQNSSQ